MPQTGQPKMSKSTKSTKSNCLNIEIHRRNVKSTA